MSSSTIPQQIVTHAQYSLKCQRKCVKSVLNKNNKNLPFPPRKSHPMRVCKMRLNTLISNPRSLPLRSSGRGDSHTEVRRTRSMSVPFKGHLQPLFPADSVMGQGARRGHTGDGCLQIMCISDQSMMVFFSTRERPPHCEPRC